jgi:very-short-patch-repair endonuclease/AraC-like DNA-binding protein
MVFNNKMTSQEVEFVFISDSEPEEENNGELTTYSYVSNYMCFEYFVGYEIASKIGYKNPAEVIKNNVSKCNQLIFRDFPGVKTPDLDPRTILITRDGAVEILLKTRKRISPDILYMLKKFGIETTNRKCLTKEQQCLLSITNTFKTEKFEDQYKVDCYYIDLYFPEYKILVEVDENGHKDRKPGDERQRMDIVNEILEIDDNHWIRFNPDEHDFDITKVIGRIYRKIDEIKQQKHNEEIEKQKKEIEKKIKEKPIVKKEEPEWKLQIEPITGKFTAPPKEYLLEKLKTHNISDIAKSYGISTNPISKWLKQYEINIKDFHNYDPPSKEELIKECKDKTQTEVALHYNVSNHIIRKWLKDYGLDFISLKSGIKQVSKEELLKLITNHSDEEVAEKLNITVLNLYKLIKTHNIDKIPSKEELEKNLHLKSKDVLAELYDTTRTTLRKWIKSYGLDHIRYQVTTNRQIISTKEDDNTKTTYSSIKELCKALHISKRKLYECVESGDYYKGYKFEFRN